MPIAYVENVGQVGVVRDTRPHELPLEAWSDGRNVRFSDQAVLKMQGMGSRLGTSSVAPYFLLPVPTASSFFWLYAGLQKVYVLENSTHTNVTRQTASVDVNYTGAAGDKWTGGVLGGIPFLNNGVDDPQIWNPAASSTKLTALTNWPANTKAGVLRAFKQFLVALDVTKTSTRYPQMVKWSHPADPGAVPVSWDPADTAKDAGEYSLLETPGFVVDAVPLRDVMVIYKEDSVWAMQYVGGNSIFRFVQIFKHFGMLSRNCAVEWNSKHYVFTGADIIEHDGQTARTLIDGKTRKWLQNNVDSTYYGMSHVVVVPQYEEVWVFVPQVGHSTPNTIVIVKIATGAISYRDANGVVSAGIGAINPAGVSDTWDTATGTWDTDSAVWGSRLYSPANKKLLLASSANTKLYAGEYLEVDESVAMTAFIERLGIGTIPDYFTNQDIKLMKGIIPRIEGTVGGQLTITPYVQMEIGAAVTTLPAQTYTIGSSSRINAFGSGKYLGFRISSNSDITWELHGYGIEFELAGRY